MEDSKIIDLYWQRDERAIEETDRQYGGYLLKIAVNILADREDGRESVNDTYLKAWESMPPHRPEVLRLYLAKITRRTAIDIFRRKTRQKRGASQYEESLSELSECISGGDRTQEAVDSRLLAEAIGEWLRGMTPQQRGVFLSRYYFMDPIRDIGGYYGFSQSKVKSMLMRLRADLKDRLEKEGFAV